MIENRDAGEQRNLSAASADAMDLSHASHHPRCAGRFPVSFQSKLIIIAGRCWVDKAAIAASIPIRWVGLFNNNTFA